MGDLGKCSRQSTKKRRLTSIRIAYKANISNYFQPKLIFFLFAFLSLLENLKLLISEVSQAAFTSSSHSKSLALLIQVSDFKSHEVSAMAVFCLLFGSNISFNLEYFSAKRHAVLNRFPVSSMSLLRLAWLSIIAFEMCTAQLKQIVESLGCLEVNITSFSSGTTIGQLEPVVLTQVRHTAITTVPTHTPNANFISKLLVIRHEILGLIILFCDSISNPSFIIELCLLLDFILFEVVYFHQVSFEIREEVILAVGWILRS